MEERCQNENLLHIGYMNDSESESGFHLYFPESKFLKFRLLLLSLGSYINRRLRLKARSTLVYFRRSRACPDYDFCKRKIVEESAYEWYMREN